MNNIFRYVSILTFFMFFQIIYSIITIGNPIPVYPDPGTVYTGFENVGSLNFTWIVLIFLIDFSINILIVYSGIYLLHYFKRITDDDIFAFSKKIFLVSLLIISMVGLFSELIFGTWFIGLLLTLLSIFISYILVSNYLLNLGWTNSILIALFALFVNLVFWFVIFMV